MMGVMIQTAILVIFILAVRKLFGEKLHAYIRYSLWLVVALRLLMPVNFIDSPFSVLRVVNALADRYAETVYENVQLNYQAEKEHFGDMIIMDRPEQDSPDYAVLDNQVAAGGAGDVWSNGQLPEAMTKPAADSQIGQADNSETAEAVVRIFCIIWAAGSLAVGGFFIVTHVRFRRWLYRMRRCCQTEKTAIPVYYVDNLESPCLVGVAHPAIYIGSGIEVGSDYFRYAVIHEQVHYLHGDHIWVLLRALLVIIYWFHPFVWIAAAASARDGEIACDYGVIRRLGDTERLSYGEMLLALSQRNRRRRVYAYGTMLRPGKSEMKERILRLTGGNSSRIWAGILVVSLLFVLAGCAFTGVSQENAAAETDAGADEAIQAAESQRSRETDTDEDVVSGSDPGEEEITGLRQLTAVPAAVSKDTEFGVDGPSLDYAGGLGMGEVSDSIIIFHDYFGLIVYDLADGKILRSLDLETIGCHMTQGDNACQVTVSADGTKVWLHPRTKPYMFRYEVEENQLYQLPLVKTFEIDLEAEDTFDRYLVTEEAYAGWRSNCLYEEYKDEKGLHTAYIYLYSSGKDVARFGSLRCVWNDEVFALWDEDEAWIRYDEPCEYSRISDSFGSRVHPATGEVKVHEGIDYVAEEGSDIMAAADGIVYETGFSDEYGGQEWILNFSIQNGK